ncbi:outer membrane protein assembly factor BamB [Streptomyces sp. CG 926]|uniref:outer membrane protein assembly factor BamB family protein n=1 Tax=Streptomyces sp. CG 926 TaxID=1882405 RepID=UPI000D6AC2CF|nr:PQQ-binding-like beta-propeller repeat protein [Streptomyces sp. CG 926]PWK70507.1 outer membrane protein assembly factor BamB [Streptomyces sp. CG 926]
MTELPQPPNQPPNQPSTPSGYGHLPGPPQQGYGFPPQGANPYAQQPAYPPQPPTVTQQPVGPGGPGPGPGPTSKKKLTLLVAASVAAVLVLGGVGYVAFSGEEKDPKPVAQEPADAKPSGSPTVDKGDGNGNGKGSDIPTDLNEGRKPGEDKALWLKTAKMEGPGAGIPARGLWVAGDTVVKTVDKSVIGYGVSDGKEKWKIDFQVEICGLTGQATPDGRTVMVVKNADGSSCNQMKLIDLKAGKEVWTKELVMEGLFKTSSSATVTLSGDTFALAWMGGQSAHRLSTGDKLFSDAGPEGCKPMTYAAGNNKMIAVALCQDADKTIEIQDADPSTGKKTWSYRLPKGFQVNAVYSVSPTVIDAGNRDTGQHSILVLDEKGQKRNTLVGEGNFVVNCGGYASSEGLQNCGNSAVDADTVYLAAGDKSTGSEIVAFDLGTGKTKWRTKAGDKKVLIPLDAANGRLTAYRADLVGRPGEIVSFPADGSAPTTLMKLPSGTSARIESSFLTSQSAAYVDGRFFLSVTRLAGENTDERLLMAFGK